MRNLSSTRALRRLCAIAAVLAIAVVAATVLGTLFWAMESVLRLQFTPSLRAWLQFAVLFPVGLKAFSLSERWCRE